MDQNIWLNPEGYQRTSRFLQWKYLKILLERSNIEGNVLDVGCGTGNAYDFLKSTSGINYTGIDISVNMIEFSRNRFPEVSDRFIAFDFLDNELVLGDDYDHVICAACLHWFHPHQNRVIRRIWNSLKPGGRLHLSTALDFSFLHGEEAIQQKTIEHVRSVFTPQSGLDTFHSRRLSVEAIKHIVSDFDVQKVSLHEEVLEFFSYEDFRDWHTGSGSVVAKQFAPEDRKAAEELYYRTLHSRYVEGEFKVAYGTALLTLTKSDDICN